ncbi:DUF885 domain-containing protein [Sphingomonas sp. AOB5]|uniref:DUF885 domain-containing protein n=1 Tax=Sphingomonas sp. AOB5 TaxID=3034017 RepID=UPI0023F67D4E|nr:DUF885 domain-containing protein [Sphingomonas sp. AOB5]MDF7774453.1 DUF885 domain-containing protein [Sphingomonas sp. AOB5]
MRVGLLAGAALLALAGCSGGGGAGNNSSAAAETPAAAADWGKFRDATIERWFVLDPSFAVYQGRHDFDGKLPDWSAAGLKAKGDFLRDTIKQAKAFTGLTGDDAFERDYVVQVAEGQLFWLEDADQPHKNPSFYVGGGLDPNTYVSREYAGADVRIRAMTAFLQGVPAAAKNIRANLKAPMPVSFIKFGRAAFGGFADYYSGDAVAAFASVKDPALQKALKEAGEGASKAMRELDAWLKTLEATATQDYVLGADRFSRMLKATEAVDMPLDQLEAVGQADLKRNRDALIAECAKYAPGADIPGCMAKMNSEKPEGGPVKAATAQIPELRDFVVKHDLVTIPGTEQALVRESPPYNRQNAAYIDPPGPFEKGIPSIYYISPPDPKWSPQEQAAYIPGEDDLLFTTVHEVMPGHFLQFVHANRSKSLFGRLFVGYAYAEGWAHYTEEMMWEAGLRDGDAATHIGQLSNALLRNCRFLSAIGLHARGMTQEQSETMFREQCYQDAGNARQQAARGTYDPAYLNYTLGKLMIRRLREDWTAKHGGRKAWKAFHDQFLSYGGPPIPLVRRAMMGEDAPKAVF